MSEAKLSTTGKILKYLAYILMIIGMGLLMLGISSFFFGVTPPLDPVYMILIGVMLLFAGFPMLAMAQQGMIKPEFDTISLIKCSTTPECKFTRAKKYERGEYIFQDLEKKCEKCDSPLYIAAIFEVEKKQPKRKLEERKKEAETEEGKPFIKGKETESK